jgi:hypothetical protein
MNNYSSKTPSISLEAEVAATGARQLNQSHDAADHSQTISEKILTTFAEWHRADHTARRLEVVVAATRPPALQREGRIYAPAKPSCPAATFDATHLMRADKVNPRQYQVKQYRNGNPLSPSVNHRVSRSPIPTSAL